MEWHPCCIGERSGKARSPVEVWNKASQVVDRWGNEWQVSRYQWRASVGGAYWCSVCSAKNEKKSPTVKIDSPSSTCSCNSNNEIKWCRQHYWPAYQIVQQSFRYVWPWICSNVSVKYSHFCSLQDLRYHFGLNRLRLVQPGQKLGIFLIEAAFIIIFIFELLISAIWRGVWNKARSDFWKGSQHWNTYQQCSQFTLNLVIV